MDFNELQRQIIAQIGVPIIDSDFTEINHLYAYANGNPLAYIDPTGEYWWVPIAVVAYGAYSTYTTLSDFMIV